MQDLDNYETQSLNGENPDSEMRNDNLNDLGENTSDEVKLENFLKKKGKDLVLDRRIAGIISVVFIIFSPLYLFQKST